MIRYCEDPFVYRRRKTRVVQAGDVGIGGSNPLRIQSMTTSPTLDTISTVRQIIELADAGCEIVRVTVPSIREAENLKNIREELKKQKVNLPIVADIHFTPNAAMKAVEFAEKIRINPGNFADKKQLTHFAYTDREYQLELERIDELFRPLVLRCKELGVSMRIGVNHGSLSDRIMSRFGDTPEGMVESAVEFVRIAERYGYGALVLSMKASNPKVMIGAYRLIAARFMELNMDYPFHLGVTEAGDGEDGRIKSSVGIGTLLEDGIGDTIRVSLTEDSVNEIPAARAVAEKYSHPIPVFSDSAVDITEYRKPVIPARRITDTLRFGCHTVGGNEPVRVTAVVSGECDSWMPSSGPSGSLFPVEAACLDYGSGDDQKLRYISGKLKERSITSIVRFHPAIALSQELIRHADVISALPDYRLSESSWNDRWENILQITGEQNKTLEILIQRDSVPAFIRDKHPEWPEQLRSFLGLLTRADEKGRTKNACFMVHDTALIYTARFVAAFLDERGDRNPIGLYYSSRHYPEPWIQTSCHSSVMLGSLLCDGIGDLVCVEDPHMELTESIRLSYNILQASRARISKAEWISCPSCGRTQFDIQSALARIKRQTAHLTGVKIAVMGCIVNGLGEMADADFGFVGAQAGKVNLYFGKTLVRRNVNMDEADRALIDMIRLYGYWKDP